MITVELRPELAEKLNTEAAHRETTLNSLVNELLKESLWRVRLNKITEESKRFQEKHAELYEKYAGKVIAMQNGQVLDQGEDIETVFTRIRAKYGDEPILITPVTREPIPTYRVLSPKRQRVSE